MIQSLGPTLDPGGQQQLVCSASSAQRRRRGLKPFDRVQQGMNSTRKRLAQDEALARSQCLSWLVLPGNENNHCQRSPQPASQTTPAIGLDPLRYDPWIRRGAPQFRRCAGRRTGVTGTRCGQAPSPSNWGAGIGRRSPVLCRRRTQSRSRCSFHGRHRLSLVGAPFRTALKSLSPSYLLTYSPRQLRQMAACA